MPRAAKSPDAIDVLIEWLYDAAVDARAWTGVAPALAAAFASNSAVFKVQGGASVQLLEMTGNLAVAPAERSWADHWHRNDLWVERSLALGKPGIVTSQQLLPAAEFERSGYYQDWNRRLGVYHMMGSVFPVNESLSGVVGIHRPRNGAAFGATDRRHLARLLPHLQRAMRIRDRLAPVRLAEDARQAAFERLGTPTLVLDAEARLLHANDQAQVLLRAHAGLSVRAGRVVADDPVLAFRWRLMVQQAARSLGGSMRFERADRAPLTALLAPLKDARDARAAVLVLLRDPEQLSASHHVLRELFGLTPTEALVASAIAEGLAPEEIALHLGIGIGTVRSHLRQTLAKTGTHRQAQLAALITRSVAMLGGSSAASQT